MVMQKTGNSDNNRAKLRRLFGWMGTTCLLLIIPIKVIRWAEGNIAASIFIGITPSILGPAGLLFLLLSSSGKLSKMTLHQLTLLITGVALGLEFAQLIPRPGILEKIKYTFDWLDVWSSLGGVIIGYLIAHRLRCHSRWSNNGT
jgi:glycopeptide antibiotics resistance protein